MTIAEEQEEVSAGKGVVGLYFCLNQSAWL